MRIKTTKNNIDIEKISILEKNNFSNSESYSLRQLNNFLNSIFIVCLENKEIIGYLIIIKGKYEDEIAKIFTSKKNIGIGTKMLNFYINKYRKSKITFLEVRSKNFIAINFYKKNNFKVVGKRKKYYGDDDAIILSL